MRSRTEVAAGVAAALAAAIVALAIVVDIAADRAVRAAKHVTSEGGVALTVPAPAREHPVWRLDRIAGRPLLPELLLVGDGAAEERRALQRHLERTADRLAPFDWRAAGVTIEVGCHPVAGDGCPLGVAVPLGARTRIVLSPASAFLTDGGLEVLVAHELAHGWQFRQAPGRRPGAALVGLDVERPVGIDLAELEADCLVVVWGIALIDEATLNYWTCPPIAVLATHTSWLAAQLP
jgi:hypothetical protein